jgi:hypothetical protein
MFFMRQKVRQNVICVNNFNSRYSIQAATAKSRPPYPDCRQRDALVPGRWHHLHSHRHRDVRRLQRY